MNALARLREICLGLPEVVERPSHGEAAWFVRGKRLFVTFAHRHHDERLAFWCAAPEGAQAAFVATRPERFFRPPYVGHRGWLSVVLDDAVDWDELKDIVTEAYRAVAPKALTDATASAQDA